MIRIDHLKPNDLQIVLELYALELHIVKLYRFDWGEDRSYASRDAECALVDAQALLEQQPMSNDYEIVVMDQQGEPIRVHKHVDGVSIFDATPQHKRHSNRKIGVRIQ